MKNAPSRWTPSCAAVVAACFPPANSIQRTIDRACSYANDPFDPVIGPLDRVVSLHSKLLTCAAYRDYPLRSG